MSAGTEIPRFHVQPTGELYVGFPAPRPCPFCDGDLHGGIINSSGDGIVEPMMFKVCCDCCGAEGPTAMSALEAARLWNQRFWARRCG